MQRLCAICNHRCSIYTCPRCSIRTCSLSCSASHKSRTKCTGDRDRTAYVPMNQYGWGTMMNDYVLLEDVERKVGEWGQRIVREGLDTSATRGHPTIRGRGRGRSAKAKREILQMQLGFLDIEMDLLPTGMNRRRLNQSYWDHKNNTALLTIEFKFHPPNHLLSLSQPSPSLFVLLTHRNSMDLPLLSLLQAHVAKSQKDTVAPDWVKSLVCQDPDDPESFSPPDYVMPADVDPLSSLVLRDKVGYYKLDPAHKLSVLLRNTHFIEYPTIEIWEVFRGTIVDVQGAITHYAEEETPPKRRRLDLKTGRKAIHNLLGGYGSDDENKTDCENVLSTLDGYAESEGGSVEDTPVQDLDDDSEEDDDPTDTGDQYEILNTARVSGPTPQASDAAFATDPDVVNPVSLSSGVAPPGPHPPIG